jgi:hypothetical protein
MIINKSEICFVLIDCIKIIFLDYWFPWSINNPEIKLLFSWGVNNPEIKLLFSWSINNYDSHENHNFYFWIIDAHDNHNFISGLLMLRDNHNFISIFDAPWETFFVLSDFIKIIFLDYWCSMIIIILFLDYWSSVRINNPEIFFVSKLYFRVTNAPW